MIAHATETFQQVKRRANVMTIVAEAADHIGDDVSDDPVDADWVARFFTYAQDVSNEQLQDLWGRVLAGEVERPGFVSLRTLAMLRNMNKADSELLLKLAARVTVDSKYLPYGGCLSLAEQVLAQDAGFLQQNQLVVRWKVTEAKQALRLPPPGSAVLQYQTRIPGEGYQLTIEAESSMYQVNMYVVSPSVLPLLNILKVPTDAAYLDSVVKALNAENVFKAALVKPGTAG